MEDYKQRYETAIKQAKKELKTCGSLDCDAARQIFGFFPELKESEDEKMMNQLHSWMKEFGGAEEYTEKVYQWIKGLLEKRGEQKLSDLPKGEDYGIDSLYHAARILEKTLGEVDGYQSDDGILEHQCAIEAVNRLYKQKSTWSKEDEEMLEGLNNWFTALEEKNGWRYIYVNSKDVELCEVRNWLKSLKERIKWEKS